uniref:Zgc:110158 n=1 Tax=Cyprinus carpio TaxID=7962 RepID=A0A8C1JQQ9_CYPCA
MYAKGKGAVVPSDNQAREKLALYVYEYLLHVGAQKSAQTFLSEIRWEKNITLGEPPGFLHSWWCVFWDLYCAAPDRRETCEHSSEAKAFHDYSAAAAPSPVMGNMPPNDGMPGGPMPPGFFQPFMSPRYPGGPRPSLRMPNQPPVGVPGSQPLLPNSLDPTRPQGHPNMGGPMRMNPPRGMGGMGPQVDTYSSPFSICSSSGSRPKSNATGLEPCYSSLVTCAESGVLPTSLSLFVLLVLGKRGTAQIGSWCSICSTNWVERKTKAWVRKKQPQA